jgi:hypothetical protein
MNSNHAFTVRKGLTPKNLIGTVPSESPVNSGVLGSGGSRLGIKTKSSSPPNSSNNDSLIKSRQVRTERYQLGRTARAIYAKAGELAGEEFVLNYHRTAKCSYIALEDPQVMMSCEHNKSFITGITLCGSIHTCPQCSAKIEERRRLEIAAGVDFWYSMHNKTVAMLTFTFSHSIGDRLSDVLDKQAVALGKLRSGKAWEKFKAVFGYDSLIRSLEITWSKENGYHPHTHELWCVDKDIDREKLAKYLKAKFRAKRHAATLERLLAADPRAVFEELLLDRWEACCERAGLMVKADGKPVCRDAFRNHAIDVKWDVSTGDYLAKQDDSRHWGADREMAKGSTKKGRKKGMHPFGFLAKFAETGDGVWSARWLEYSAAIEGKSRLYWSTGLKARAGIDDKTDEQINDEVRENGDLRYKMSQPEWRKARHNIPRVLESAEDGENIQKVIENIVELDHFGEQPDRKAQLLELNQPAPEDRLLSLDAYLSAANGERSASLIRCVSPTPTEVKAQAMIDRFQRSNSA